MVQSFGLVRTVVSILHCGCSDPGSIPGLDIYNACHDAGETWQHNPSNCHTFYLEVTVDMGCAIDIHD